MITRNKVTLKQEHVTQKRKTRTQLRLAPLSEKVTRRHLTYVVLFNGKGINGAVCLASACYIFPPAPIGAQSVTRIAGSGTTVYKCCKLSQSVQGCASFVSSSRSSNRTTTRSSPHTRIPDIVDTSKTKAQIWAKGTPDKRKKREETFFLQEYFRRGNYFCITVLY